MVGTTYIFAISNSIGFEGTPTNAQSLDINIFHFPTSRSIRKNQVAWKTSRFAKWLTNRLWHCAIPILEPLPCSYHHGTAFCPELTGLSVYTGLLKRLYGIATYLGSPSSAVLADFRPFTGSLLKGEVMAVGARESAPRRCCGTSVYIWASHCVTFRVCGPSCLICRKHCGICETNVALPSLGWSRICSETDKVHCGCRLALSPRICWHTRLRCYSSMGKTWSTSSISKQRP